MPSAPLLGGIGDVERLRLERVVVQIADGADLLEILVLRIGWRTSSRLRRPAPSQVEQVRPRPDEGDEAHDEFLADRIDRRVRHLGEVLLEIGVEQLRLVGEHRDRRIRAHRADGFLAGGRHRRHQQLQVFLRVAEGLLAIEQASRRCAARAAARAAGPPARSGCAPASPG